MTMFNIDHPSTPLELFFNFGSLAKSPHLGEVVSIVMYLLHRTSWAILVLVCCLSAGLLHAAPPSYEFQSKKQGLGWQAINHVGNAGFTSDGLTFTISGNDPQLISPAADFTAKETLCIHLKLHSEAGGRGQIFYLENGAGSREDNSLSFTADANTWTEVRLPLPPLGKNTKLRFDPPGGSGRCTISYIRVEALDGFGVTDILPSGQELQVSVNGNEPLYLIEVPIHSGFSTVGYAPVLKVFPVSRAFSIPRFDGDRDRLYSGFITIRTNAFGQRETVGPIRYATKLINISTNKSAYPTAESKKGLQVQMVDDALKLGIKHAAININLTALVDPSKREGNYSWKMDGETFYFNRGYLDSLGVKPLSDNGVNVSLIILAYKTGDPARDMLIHPWCDSSAPNRLGAFNVRSSIGVKWYKACMEFLADHYSNSKNNYGRVWGYIIGNEVNSHWYWYNLGNAPRTIVAQEYEKAVRIANIAVRKASANARVYLSLEHHWNMSYDQNIFRTCPGRVLLEDFNRFAQMGGNYDWHLAYHPYPENLMDPRTWLDKTATPEEQTQRITFKNIEMLPRFLNQPSMRFDDKPRRVILSEQGFNSGFSGEMEILQAAAYCYAYKRVEYMDGIDAFIYHRHVDNAAEGDALFGLWRRQANSTGTPAVAKVIYTMFMYADTPRWQQEFGFALPIIGINNWNEISQ